MGSILVISPFNIKQEKRAEFAKWLKSNEEKLRKALALVGCTYRGTYMTTFGLGPSDGISIVEYSSFEDMDVWRELSDRKVDKVMAGWMSFAERCSVSPQMYEQAPEAFAQVVVRKHKGKRAAK